MNKTLNSLSEYLKVKVDTNKQNGAVRKIIFM